MTALQEDLLRVACASSPQLRDRVQRSLYAQYVVKAPLECCEHCGPDDSGTPHDGPCSQCAEPEAVVVLWSLDAAKRVQSKAVLTTVRTDGQFIKHVVVGRSHAAIQEYIHWNTTCNPLIDHTDLETLDDETWLWRAIGHECGETVDIVCPTCDWCGVTATGLDYDLDFTFICDRCDAAFWKHPGDVAAELEQPRPSITAKCHSCGVDTRHKYALTICQAHPDRAFYRCAECKTVTEVTY